MKGKGHVNSNVRWWSYEKRNQGITFEAKM